MTDDLLRQIWETVKCFSWLFVANQEPELAFRGKAWRYQQSIMVGQPHGSTWLTTGGRSGTERGECFAYGYSETEAGVGSGAEHNSSERMIKWVRYSARLQCVVQAGVPE